MSLSCVIASEIAFKTASSADKRGALLPRARRGGRLPFELHHRSRGALTLEFRRLHRDRRCGEAGVASTVSSALIISLRSGVRITN